MSKATITISYDFGTITWVVDEDDAMTAEIAISEVVDANPTSDTTPKVGI